MKLWVFLFAVVAVAVSFAVAYPASHADIDADYYLRQLIGRALAKGKRSPSIGLSLAEYMAGPQTGDTLHFLSGR